MNSFKDSILRVLRGDTVVGAAFLVSDRLVATCAHVVVSARAKVGENISLRLSDGLIVDAIVEPEFWRDPNTDDVSILRLKKSVGNLQPLLLGSSYGTKGHPFSTFGFPNQGQELNGDGKVVDQSTIFGIRVLQLDSKQVTPGFSGAPIFDENTKRIVGMVVEIARPDEYLRLGTTAFAIPSETICEICPELPIVATHSELANELIKLPGMGKVDLFIIRNVYGLSLEEISLYESSLGNTSGMSELILALSQAVPKRDDQARPLAYFAATLADRLKNTDSNLSEMLLVWLKKHAKNLMADPENLGGLIRVDPEVINPPCLQIILEPSLDYLNADPKNKQYLLTLRDVSNDKLIISKQTLGIKDIQHLVQKGLDICLDTFTSGPASAFDDLFWIEFCLPNLDLSLNVEQWPAYDQEGETLGQTFKVVVRSKYRWEKRRRLIKTWPGKWDVCKAALSNRPVKLNQTVILKSTAGNFMEKVENVHVVGMPFELQDDDVNGNFLTMLLDGGVPIAIWVRHNSINQDAKKWLKEHISDNLDLRRLAEQVRLERRKGSDLGKSLVLLWDNYDHKLDVGFSYKAPTMQTENPNGKG